MISAWGVEHGEVVSKAQKKKRDYSAAAVGTGATVGGVGLVGGGVPGARPDSGRLAHVKAGTKYEATRHLVSAGRGGIFGYREDAHRAYGNRLNSDLRGWKPHSRSNRFERGVFQGKARAENDIIRTLRKGRVASNVAAGVGATAVGAGLLNRRKQKQTVSKARKRDDFGSNTAIAGGTSLAGVAGGGSLALDRQGRMWSNRSAQHLRDSQKLARKTGGYDVKTTKARPLRKGSMHTRVPDVNPHRSVGSITHDKDVFAGRSNKVATDAGKLRGQATQARYFAKIYGTTARSARKVGLAGVGIAGAGLGTKHYELKRKR